MVFGRFISISKWRHQMTAVQIARICHEVNRTYCEAIGDTSQKPWPEAEIWQQQSALLGVEFLIDHPDAPPSAQHEAWRKTKEKEGWVYGPVKDSAKKTHPCMVSYAKLPALQQIKDKLFQAVVRAALAGL
jgi:hypothetical protein